MENIFKKRKNFFTIKMKLDILRAFDSGKPKTDIVNEFGVHTSTLNSIIRNRETLESTSKVISFGPSRKHVRYSQYDDIEKALMKWYLDKSIKGVIINSKMAKKKASMLAAQFGQNSFVPAAYWFSRFRKKYHISKNFEYCSVTKDWIDQWRSAELSKNINNFSSRDIFAAFEAGFFYRLLPSQTPYMRNLTCDNGEKIKERLTVLLCCNATGTEKMRPLIIGSCSYRKLCNRSYEYPYKYEFDKSAWITPRIFNQWLREFDREMKSCNRKILLLLNDSPAHDMIPRTENIVIEILQPKSGTALQPFKLGIIQTVKVFYRKYVLERIISDMNNGTNYAFINIAQAMHMICNAWESVTSDTIAFCWVKSGNAGNPLSYATLGNVNSFEDEEIENLWEMAMYNNPSGVTLVEYITVDSKVHVTNEKFELWGLDEECSDSESSDSDSDSTKSEGYC